MSLTTLPDDILIEVLACLQPDTTTLRNLALVSHCLSALALAFLFRHLETRSLESVELLERSFQENTDLMRHLRSCSVRASSKEGKPQDLILKDLARFPNLYELKLCIDSRVRQPHRISSAPRSVITPFAPPRTHPPLDTERITDFDDDFVGMLSRSGIKSVHLSSSPPWKMGTKITCAVVIRILLMDGLCSLRLSNLSQLGDIEPSPIFTDQKSNVNCLQLHGNRFWSVAASEIKTILNYTPFLKEFRCSLPGESRPKADKGPVKMLRLFHGPDLLDLLAPLRDSLQVLELNDNCQIWPGRQPLPFVLSSFNRLRRIVAPSICFFQLGPPQMDRYELCSQLPPSLEELSVSIRKHLLYPGPAQLLPNSLT